MDECWSSNNAIKISLFHGPPDKKKSSKLLNLLPLLHTETLYFTSPKLLGFLASNLLPPEGSHQNSRIVCFLLPSLTNPHPPHYQANTHLLLPTVSCLSFQSSVFKEFINFVLFMLLFICRLNCLNIKAWKILQKFLISWSSCLCHRSK